MAHSERIRLGDQLLKDGLISEEQLQRALGEQKRTSRMLGELLVETGVITSGTLARTLARCLGVPSCQLRHGLADPPLLRLIGAEEAERLKVLPMFKVRETLTVAMAEPQSLPTIDRLRQLTGCKIRRCWRWKRTSWSS